MITSNARVGPKPLSQSITVLPNDFRNKLLTNFITIQQIYSKFWAKINTFEFDLVLIVVIIEIMGSLNGAFAAFPVVSTSVLSLY